MKNLMLYCLVACIISGCTSGDNPHEMTLNEGEKWEMDIGMKPPVENGMMILEDYSSTGKTDYKKLAQKLSTQNKNLIQSCTMQGQAHEELHKWLMPHIELTDELSEAASSDEAQVLIEQLKKSFQTYQNYFK